MRFECVSRTHVGLKRKINEDSVLAEPGRGLWAVADGMGGHDAGEVASNMVTDALRCLPPANDLDAFATQVVAALRQVNGELIELARSGAHDRHATIGTTVVGLVIADGAFRCFWMGDSRAYRLRDGEFTRLTHDHSLVQNLIDAGMLKPAEAETHESANLVTRAVGASADAEVDMVSGDVRPGDRFLLASDGLTRLVRDPELAQELQRAPAAEVADTLLDTVLARGAPDNVSLVLADVL